MSIEHAHQTITAKAVVLNTTGITAAGVSSAPTSMYNEYLTSNGLGVLSFAEIIQLVGFVYVLCLLIKTLIPVFKCVAGFIGGLLK